MIMIPMTSPAARALSEETESPSASPHSRKAGRHRQRREETINDGGDAGEDLQHRLDQRPDARRSVLRHVDRRKQADRCSDAHGDEGDQHGAGQQRDHPEATGRTDLIGAQRHLRAPLQSEQEIERRNLGEKTPGLEHQG
jgi:hypothetical protein